MNRFVGDLCAVAEKDFIPKERVQLFVIALLMLIAPGLITLRILWFKKGVNREDYKYIFCDYVIFSFLIHTMVYGLMFITYPERSVSFVTNVWAVSHILSASFVFKYSVFALVISVVLSFFVPWLIKFTIGSEENKDIKKTEE